jgi:hypothetical protein
MRNITRSVRDCHGIVDVTSGETCHLEGRRRQEGVEEDGRIPGREDTIFFENTGYLE